MPAGVQPLPAGLNVYKRTPEFDEATIPAGLLRAHTTKPGVWARIVVLEGTLTYRVAGSGVELLDDSRVGIVQPEVPHQVEPQGKVRFYVEFLK